MTVCLTPHQFGALVFHPLQPALQSLSPLTPCNRPEGEVGPSSNTGQKSRSSLSAPILDFCTVVIPKGALKKSGCRDFRELLDWIFSTGRSVAMGSIQDRSWNFYPQSATLVDETGSVAGKVGFAQDGSLCYSLTGQGCQHVRSWSLAAHRLGELGAHLTRLDIAIDDLKGEFFNVKTFEDWYDGGEFTMNGRPPTAQFVDDKGSGKGCTLYIGQKGHKQLCIYEKGKQLGDPNSDHTRCELRLYAKRLELPLDALVNPGNYFGSAYPMLVAFVIGEAEKLLIKERLVNPSAVATVRFLRTQTGTALNLVFDCLGDDALEFICKKILRKGRPARFKNTSGDLIALVRSQLLEISNEAHHQL